MNREYLSKEQQEFEQRVRTALDSSITSLDADTRARLAAGRAGAFERDSWLARWLPSGTWIPATAFAVCALLAVTLFVANRHTDVPIQIAQSDADFAVELLLGSDDEDEDVEENGPTADAAPDFFIQMEAMMLHDEEKLNAG